ncbi:Ectoine hydroxylase-related dioxygenase, phytanoyl-CoA dioxygenase (PhyH) family [Halogranum amylolyticum]|uniref:Ectoine hydroxylase-related dioxygenase, phytanoyl-CoA dioxygenase (PhyH) family n=1 Tax=Halogranum amylolyticum TaxID=660520 RepID=A0A1H8W8L6_9EURY|nr:phytanoyl-CoA dioxygenase family protein [Halogranum amylolyticum]SEP24015.1 Ectoine hydroxylase-related dioxygenase, phytanoyl-CoA dioxygenase (PhyH) family [Halogranum amylolyticum]
MTLTDAQFEQYQREGYVVVEDLLPPETVERVKTRLREYVTGERTETEFGRMLEPNAETFAGDGDPVRKFEGVGMVREDDVFHDLAFDDAILDVIHQLQGPNLKLLRSAAMLKPPRVGSEKKFHQDAAYYPIHPMDHVTVWIALDEATTDNGCMQVVPGGHTDGLLRHETLEYDTDITLTGREYGSDDTVALPMTPGSVLFQHCLLPHYTAENTTDDWRRAFILSYMRSRSRFTEANPPEWVDSLHVAGKQFPGCV